MPLRAGGGSTIGPPLVQEALGEIASGIWPINHVSQLQFLPLVFPVDGAVDANATSFTECATYANDSDTRILVGVELLHADSAISNTMYVFNAGATQFETGINPDGSQFGFQDSTYACSCSDTGCGNANIGDGDAAALWTITGFKYYAFRYAAIWLNDTSHLESMVTTNLAGFSNKRVELLPCEMTLKGHKRIDGLCPANLAFECIPKPVCREDGPTISVVNVEDSTGEFYYGAALSVPIPKCESGTQVLNAAGLIFKLEVGPGTFPEIVSTKTFDVCGDSVVAFGSDKCQPQCTAAMCDSSDGLESKFDLSGCPGSLTRCSCSKTCVANQDCCYDFVAQGFTYTNCSATTATTITNMHETEMTTYQELDSSLLSSPAVIHSRVTFTIREVCLTEDYCYDLSKGPRAPDVCIPCNTCPSGTTDNTDCRHDSGDYTRMGVGECLVGDSVPPYKMYNDDLSGCETKCSEYGPDCIGFNHADNAPNPCHIHGYDTTFFDQQSLGTATAGYITSATGPGTGDCYAKKYAPEASTSASTSASTGWHTWEIVACAAGVAVVALFLAYAAVYYTKTNTNLEPTAYALMRM